MRRSTVIMLVSSSLVAVSLLAVAMSVAWRRSTEWPFRRELPQTATEIHESFWEDSLLPDNSYRLKAKTTAEEFREYCRRFGLTPHSLDRVYEEWPDIYLGWSASWPDTGDPWWNPSEGLEGTFAAQGSDTWTFAKHERGYLFLQSLNY